MINAPQLYADHAARVPCAHVLDCVAGFFATEAEALAVGQQLQSMHGLKSAQEVLLGPAHSGWLSFTRQAKAWAPRRSADSRSSSVHAPLVALLSGFVLSLAVATWLVLGADNDSIGTDAGALFYLLTPLVGAGLGWAASGWIPLAAHYQRFNVKVRSELAAGRWVLLTRDVGWSKQGGVLELMCSRAVGWCVVSASQWHLWPDGAAHDQAPG